LETIIVAIPDPDAIKISNEDLKYHLLTL